MLILNQEFEVSSKLLDKMTDSINTDFHLGKLIREELERQKRSVKWLAESINCDRSNCYHIFERKYIDIDLLERISKALSHNFFDELSKYMESVVKVST